MIYETLNSSDSIKQGDIFQNIPRIDMSLLGIPIIGDDETTSLENWKDLVEEDNNKFAAILPISKVQGIVITQNCDCQTSTFVNLCQIRPFCEMEKNTPTTPKRWANFIRKKSRESLRYFYLPEDKKFGFNERMISDFLTIITIKREELNQIKEYRLGRLNNIAYENFRETLSQFFRRYPYDEWYPFTKEEFDAYKLDYPQSEPFDWQK